MWTGLETLKELWLNKNSISVIEDDTFKGLDKLENLWLDWNNLTVIRKDMFCGLSSLQELSLDHNHISQIKAHTFQHLPNLWALTLADNRIHLIETETLANLPKLKLLYIDKNNLTTLEWTMFDVNDYGDSNGHPFKLEVTLNDNPFQCNQSLCWLKQAEKDGWLTWGAQSSITHSPQCTNFPSASWNNISLRCTSHGNCTGYNQSRCTAECINPIVKTVGELYPDVSCAMNTMGCRCCKRFDHEQCHSNCQVEGKNVIEEVRDHKGCPVCQCACPIFSASKCQAECDSYEKVPIPRVTSPYECLLCQCTCPSLDEDFCQSQCEAQGRTMLAEATNLYGCPDCQCIDEQTGAKSFSEKPQIAKDFTSTSTSTTSTVSVTTEYVESIVHNSTNTTDDKIATTAVFVVSADTSDQTNGTLTIILIAVGSVLGIVLSIVIVLWIRRCVNLRKNRQAENSEHDYAEIDYGSRRMTTGYELSAVDSGSLLWKVINVPAKDKYDGSTEVTYYTDCQPITIFDNVAEDIQPTGEPVQCDTYFGSANVTEYSNSGSSTRNDVETDDNNAENDPTGTASKGIYHGSVDVTRYDYGASNAQSVNRESENTVNTQDALDTYDGSVGITNYDESTPENIQSDTGRDGNEPVSVRLRRQTEPSDNVEFAPPMPSKIQRLSLPVIPTQDQFNLKPNRWSFQQTPSNIKTRHSFRIERLTSV